MRQKSLIGKDSDVLEKTKHKVLIHSILLFSFHFQVSCKSIRKERMLLCPLNHIPVTPRIRQCREDKSIFYGSLAT